MSDYLHHEPDSPISPEERMDETDSHALTEKRRDVDALLAGIRRTVFPYFIAYEASQQEQHESTPLGELTLMRLCKVRYRERKDIHYAMASLFSALHGMNRKVVFILTGDRSQCSLYLGFRGTQLGEGYRESLKAILKGFLPGTEFDSLPETDSAALAGSLQEFSHVQAMVGVPSEKQLVQDERRMNPVEYGIERLADAMTSDRYALVITAEPVSESEAANYYRQLSSVLDDTHELVKSSQQSTHGTQSGSNRTESSNVSMGKQHGEQNSSSDSVTMQPGLLDRKNMKERGSGLSNWGKELFNWGRSLEKKKGFWKSIGFSWERLSQGWEAFAYGGEKPAKQHTEQHGETDSSSVNWGTSSSVGISKGVSESESETLEHINHQALLAEELLKMIQTRLKNGVGEGLWQTGVYMLSDSHDSAAKGCNILRGMWSGAQSHQDPVRTLELTKVFEDGTRCTLHHALALMEKRVMDEHPLGNAYAGGYTWLTSGELALEANLPYYELPSLSSEPIVDYGRYLPSHNPAQQRIRLGKLIDHDILTNTPVEMSTDRLNRHLFVTGLTGAGKSNTVSFILLELARLGIPFLVIEPVKAEYRKLSAEITRRSRANEGQSAFAALDVFSLSESEHTEKPAFNPFAFELREGEDCGTALIAHIDRFKAVFASSLGMYSSMPYVLEDMIYKAYQKAGWDMETGKNRYFEKARAYLGLPEHAELRNLFLPILSDLIGLVDESINDFFPDKSDYGVSLVGALKSRLNSLTRGAKGQLLNRRLSLPMSTLLSRPCVIELEKLADNDEKAFVMALLLSRIYEYRIGTRASKLEHVLVVEEAHRLLAKPSSTGEHASSSRGKSVEVFTDMLAEIRAYGQGLVIADQIPDKLVPDVIKNTDVKIVHRLMAKEDREAVGMAMNLSEQQIKDLNRATPGVATVSFDGLNSAIRIKVDEVKLESISPSRTTANTHGEAMAACRQNIFLPKEQSRSPRRVDAARARCEMCRLFLLAALTDNKDNELGQLRYKLTGGFRGLSRTDSIERRDLLAYVTEGAHLLIHEFCNQGMHPGEAAQIACAFVAFARFWSQETPFGKQLQIFQELVVRPINFHNSADAIRKDPLDMMLQLWLEMHPDFQREATDALRLCRVGDISPLQEILSRGMDDLSHKLLPTDDNVGSLQLMLRLMRALNLPENDAALRQRAALACHHLLSLLPPEGSVLLQQTIEIY